MNNIRFLLQDHYIFIVDYFQAGSDEPGNSALVISVAVVSVLLFLVVTVVIIIIGMHIYTQRRPNSLGDQAQQQQNHLRVNL